MSVLILLKTLLSGCNLECKKNGGIIVGDINKIIIALMSLKGVGPVTVERILKEERIDYNNCEEFLKYSNFKKIKLFKTKIANDKLNETDWDLAINHAESVLKKCKEEKIDVISFYDDMYPANLKALKKYPLILYVKGNISILNTDKSVAIVGTRKPTPMGAKMAQAFGRKFGNDGYVIVSGLAIGCDSYGHEGALEADAPTVAILAHGLDLPVYPKQNRELADRILEQGGALISTYEPGTKLLPQYLAARDDWQSGMSDGVVAVETGIKGGTLHAINHALHNNRPLGMLDFSAKNDIEEDKIPGGNRKYISERKAVGLFSSEDVEKFEEQMQAERKKRIQAEYTGRVQVKNKDRQEKADVLADTQLSLKL